MNSIYKTELIGETSAGATCIHIYKDDQLFWSHNFFENGATNKRYIDGMRQAYDTAMDCDTVESWAEFRNENEPVDYLLDNTCYVFATYSKPGGWNFEEPVADGQTIDFFIHNSDRIPIETVLAWCEDDYEFCNSLIRKTAIKALSVMTDDEIIECAESCTDLQFVNCIVSINSSGEFKTTSDLNIPDIDEITLCTDPIIFLEQIGFDFNDDMDPIITEPLNATDIRDVLKNCYLSYL